MSVALSKMELAKMLPRKKQVNETPVTAIKENFRIVPRASRAPAPPPTEAADEILATSIAQIRTISETIRDHIFSDEDASRSVGVWFSKPSKELAQLAKTLKGHLRSVEVDSEELERLLFYCHLYRNPSSTYENLREKASELMKNSSTLEVTLFDIAVSPEALLKACNDKRLYVARDPLELYDLSRLFHYSYDLITFGDVRLLHGGPAKRAMSRLLDVKRWILEYFTPQEAHRFMLIGSSVLFSYGLRIPEDVDLYVHNAEGDMDFVRKFEKALEYAPAHFSKRVDVILRGFGKWNEATTSRERFLDLETKYLTFWPQSFGAETMDEVIKSDKYHHYFLGLKCVGFSGEIQRRIRRTTPAAYADLIYMKSQPKLLTQCNFAIPSLPEYIFHEHKWVQLTQEERDCFFKRIQSYLKSRYAKTIPVEEIEKIVNSGPPMEPFNYRGVGAEEEVKSGECSPRVERHEELLKLEVVSPPVANATVLKRDSTPPSRPQGTVLKTGRLVMPGQEKRKLRFN